MAEGAKQVQAQTAAQLKAYWQQRYTDYQAGQESTQAMPLRQSVVDMGSGSGVGLQAAQLSDEVPEAVRESYNFYNQHVMQQDWGTVSVAQVDLGDRPGFAVVTTTDGDDGWLELFDAEGQLMGAARTYLELVAWGDPSELREMVETGEFPPELADRDQMTLWGQAAE